jgi:hypothetical protein
MGNTRSSPGEAKLKRIIERMHIISEQPDQHVIYL